MLMLRASLQVKIAVQMHVMYCQRTLQSKFLGLQLTDYMKSFKIKWAWYSSLKGLPENQNGKRGNGK